MDYKFIKINKYGLHICFFGVFFIDIDQRAGSAFILQFHKTCGFHDGVVPLIHINYIHFHIHTWSLTISWKSDNCYE